MEINMFDYLFYKTGLAVQAIWIHDWGLSSIQFTTTNTGNKQGSHKPKSSVRYVVEVNLISNTSVL